MIRFAYCLIFVCLTFSFSGCDVETVEIVPKNVDDEWVVHKDGNMSVKLPFKPKLQTQNIQHPILGKLEIKIYSCEISRKKALLVSKIKYPVSPKLYDVQGGLKGAVKGMAKESKGKIESDKSIKMGTIPGKEVVMSTPSILHAKARIFIDGNGPTLYQFQAIGEKSFLEEQAVKDFMESIDIKPIAAANKGGEKKKSEEKSKEAYK